MFQLAEKHGESSIVEVNSKNFLQDDVSNFYDLISECVGKKLSESKNLICLQKPDWDSHNVFKSVLCKIENNGYVCLKKYTKNFHFVRQEELTLKLKKIVGFSFYNVIKSEKLFLRLLATQKNLEILSGWEKNVFLAIDFGNYTQTKNLLDLSLDKIKELDSFYKQYGQWAAFNYLFGIQDRNSSNFIYSMDTGIMHSVDNEAGPFDWLNRNIGVVDIIYRTRKGFRRFLKSSKKSEYKNLLKEGFISGWNQILKNIDKINILNDNEMALFQKKICDDPHQIARIFFDFDGKWNKL